MVKMQSLDLDLAALMLACLSKVLKLQNLEPLLCAFLLAIKMGEAKYHHGSLRHVFAKFVLDYSPDLKTSMEKLSYEVTSVRSLKKFVDIGKLLIPTFDLNSFFSSRKNFFQR